MIAHILHGLSLSITQANMTTPETRRQHSEQIIAWQD
jgi:hypothetical protein